MERKGIAAIVLLTIVIGGLGTGGVILMLNNSAAQYVLGLFGSSLADYVENKGPQITLLEISGNSSDIVYPELMHARFTPKSSGEFSVTATFLDDSGEYPAPFTYDKSFTTSVDEVQSINSALYNDLTGTYASNDTSSEIDESMGFELTIHYSDGSWIYLLTIQSAKNHIFMLSGWGAVDRNLVYAQVLESEDGLAGLASAMNEIFTNHLD
ncbi:MAG: hypothetical protein RTU30_13415 [Candidatus Thorarchaeota archaeon]